MGKPADPPVIAIDLLRFGCASLVVLRHFANYWSPGVHAAALAAHPGAPIDTAFTRAGAIGVELFFVISGMVIARSVVGSDWSAFLRRRILRLAPAAWICATITALLVLAGGFADGALGAQWLRALLFVPNTDLIDPSYWTLGVELNFYLLVTVLCGSCASGRMVERLGVALGAASCAFWLAYLARWVPRDVLEGFTLTLSLLPHGLFFALGIMIARGQAGDVGRLGWAVGVACALMAMVEIGAHFGGGGTRWVASALFLGGIATLLGAARLQPLLAAIIHPATARTLGLMTYPLYLIHQRAGTVVAAVWLDAGASRATALVLTAAVMLAAAWLIAVVAEPALRRLMAAALSPRTAGPVFRSVS